jgi:DNA-binding transcriptional ArsR family regulator
MTESPRSGREKILMACVLADGPLRAIDISRVTGLRKSTVSFHLPRMVGTGLLLQVEHEGITYYQPQPIFLCDDLPEMILEIYTSIVERHEDFFVFDQTNATRVRVMRNCIMESLKLFCLDIRELMKDE